MARFCVAFNMTPTEYRQLTLLEYKYLVEAYNERNVEE